jgi:F0F1-type ATP synthase assembly protein I
MPKQGADNLWQLIGKYTSIAFLLPSAVFIGYAIGYGLDKLFGATYLKIVFLIVGIAAGMIELVRELSKEAKEAESEAQRQTSSTKKR